MFGSMGQSAVKNLGNGGTMDGDVTITGDLTVNGGGSLSFDEIIEGTQQIKVNSTSALLVEKADGTDIFKVDTTNSKVIATELDISGNVDIDGTLNVDAIDIDGALQLDSTLTVGTDGSGQDVTFYSDTAGDSFVWDSSEEKLTITGTNGQTALDIADGNLVVADNIDVEGDIDINGTTNLDSVDIDGNVQLDGTLTVGTDGSGQDVIFYSATSGDNFTWDASAEKLTITGTNGQTALDVADGNLVVADNIDVEGDIDINGTANLDAVDIDGAVQIDSTLTVGVDDTGYDVKFFGDTATNGYMLWDTSTDDLILGSASKLGIGTTSPDDYSDHANHLVIADSSHAGVTIVSGTSNAGKIHFADGTSGDAAYRGYINYTHSDGSLSDYFTIGTAATARAYINSSGYLGLGVNPTAPVHIKQDNSTTDTTNGLLIENDGTGDAVAQFLLTGTKRVMMGIDNSDSDNFKIVQGVSDLGTADGLIMSIDSSRNPTFKGNVLISKATPTLTLQQTDSSSNHIEMKNSGGSVVGRLQYDTAGGNHMYLENRNAGNLVLETNDAARLTVDGSGDIGIGTTSPATDVDLSRSAGYAEVALSCFSTTNTHHGSLVFKKSANATIGTYEKTDDGESLGFIGFNGTNDASGGDASARGSYIYVTQNGSIGSGGTVVPSKMAFLNSNTTEGIVNMVLDANSRISLSNNDDGASNTIFGKNAGDKDGAGDLNVYIGELSGGTGTQTDASDANVGIGYNALTDITTGYSNVGVGYNALHNVTTGHNNVSIGSETLNACTVGQYNIAIGRQTLYTDDEGNGTTAVGHSAGAFQNLSGTNTESGITLLGYSTGYYNVTGTANTYIGYKSGYGASGQSNTGNTGVGFESLLDITSGEYNTSIGWKSGHNLQDGDYNVFLGNYAGEGTTTGEKMTFIGGASGRGVATDAAVGSVGVGYAALNAITSGAGNTAIGYEAGDTITTTGGNTIIGHSAASNGTIGANNTIVGYDAFNANISGAASCVVVGKSALAAAHDQTGTVAVGASALGVCTTSPSNVAMGYQSLDALTTGSGENTAIGNGALGALQTGAYNTAVGYNALVSVEGSASNNIAVGRSAGYNITTGENNTVIGRSSSTGAADSSNETVIGYSVAGNGSNTVTLGDENVTAVYMSQDSGALVHTAGIQFPASQVANAGANVLDDYEEGTWTPVIVSGSTTITRSGGTETATYTKIGNKVTVQFSFDSITTAGSFENAATTITGLPFTSSNTKNRIAHGTMFSIFGNTSFSAVPEFTRIIGGTTVVDIMTQSATAYATVEIDAVGSGTWGGFSITYFTD